MKIYKYGFIGHDDTNTIKYWDSDSDQEKFERTLKDMPMDWYFRTAEISYKLNSLGHRSKEIEELDLDNYILTIGCSHTEGVGMPLEKTYSYLLSKKLKCDYYNLAIGGTGMDVVLHNLTIWFLTVPKPPKAVIIQWPDITRTLTGTAPDILRPRGLWENNKAYEAFVNLAINIDFFKAKKVLAHALIQSMIKVPTVYFGIHRVLPFNEDTIVEPIVDHARDLVHPGVKSHELFAESIYDHLINTLCLSSYQNPVEKS